VAAVGLIVPAVVAAGPDDAGAVRFGNPSAGSPYQPPVFFHDSSSNATDKLIPRTVVISAGGNVTFTVAGFHQLLCTRRARKLRTSRCQTFPPNLQINDPTNRLDCSRRHRAFNDRIRHRRERSRRQGATHPLQHHRALAVDKMYGWVIVMTAIGVGVLGRGSLTPTTPN
jgi:hypothetical protein